MALLEQLLVVFGNAGPWPQYDCEAVVDLWRKKRRVHGLRIPRKRRRVPKFFDKDSGSEEETIVPDDEDCLTDASLSSSSPSPASSLSAHPIMIL